HRRRLGPDHGRPAAAHLPHPARHGDARHGPESGGGQPDGGQYQPRHRRRLRHRLGARRGGRRHGRLLLRNRPLPDGLHARPQGLHGGRARRHRQPRRGDGRRHPARPDRGAGGGLYRRPDRRLPGQPLPGHLRLHRPDRRPDVQAFRAVRREDRRPGMSKWLTPRSILGVVLIGAALIALPFVAAMGGQAWVRILNFAILYVFLALGLNIVVGFAGLLDLGYIAFYAVGAYVYALLASPHFGLHWPFWVILPLGALVTCFFGVLLGSRALKLRGDYLAIVTLGFGEIIRIFLNNLNAPINVTNGAQGITLIDPVAI